MASLHKDPRGRSPFWYCAYTLPDGRRVFRSTKQRERKKAAEVCRALEKATAKAREGELTEARVRKLLEDVLESVGHSPIRTETVRSFFNAWLEGKKLSTRPNVHRNYARSVERFLAWLGTRADKALASLVSADIATFRNSRISSVASGTLLLDLKLIRSALASAHRQGLILTDPSQTVELPANKPLERKIFTSTELRALLEVASEEWRTLILTGYFLGGRLSDMVALGWDNVDLSGGVVIYTQAKTNRRVEVPLHPELEEHLLSIARDQRSTFLCPTLAHIRLDGGRGLSARFAKLMSKAEVSREEVQSAKNKFSRKSFHSLRHSFASALANAGVAPELRMRLAGHTTSASHLRYTHHELTPLRAAIRALPRLSGGGPS
jgi:integrase